MSMGRNRALPGILILCGILVGCDEDLVGPVDLEDVTLDFSVRVLRFSDPDPTFVSGGGGTIGAWGSLRTGMCGYEVTGTLSQGPKGVDLNIEAEHTAGFDVPCHYRYEAIVRDLPPGHHLLRILHRVGGSNTVVFSKTVKVK